MDQYLAPEGRVMEVLSEHLCQGWLEGYLLTGRHGLFNCYEAFIHIVDSMFNQHAKWLKVTRTIPWRAPIASLNYLLSSHVWRQDNNGFSHQDPGFIDHVVNKKAEVVRVYLPPDTNCLLSVADHCLRSRDYVNVIVAGKQPALDYLSIEEAIDALHARDRRLGLGQQRRRTGARRGTRLRRRRPTLETLAAAAILMRELPELKVRVVNVVDLMRLEPESEHPHGLSDREFDALFTTSRQVIFAYHGYPSLIHRLTYRRTNHDNIHVRGYKEEGTTTTPFDMVMLNDLDRFHLVMDVIDRVPGLGERHAQLRQRMEDERLRHRAYTRAHGDGPAGVAQLDLAGAARRRVGGPAGAGADRQRRLEQPQARAARRRGPRARRAGAAGRRGGGRRRRWGRRSRASCGARRRLAPDRPRGRALHAPGAARRRRRTGAGGAERAGAAAPAQEPGCAGEVREALPGVPHVACFDTAFHATIPAAAAHLRAAGAPGASAIRCAASASTASRTRGWPPVSRGSWPGPTAARIVSCHLGAGASVCAIEGGRSCDTTMGFTPLEGLVMATRSGSVDPGMLPWLMEHEQLSPAQLTDALEHRSGLLGLAGTGDMREVLRRGRRAARSGRASRWRLRPPPARRDRRDGRRDRRRATCWFSPAASASARRRCAGPPPRDWGSWGSHSTASANTRRPSGLRGRSTRRRRAHARRCTPARTSSSPGAPGPYSTRAARPASCPTTAVGVARGRLSRSIVEMPDDGQPAQSQPGPGGSPQDPAGPARTGRPCRPTPPAPTAPIRTRRCRATSAAGRWRPRPDGRGMPEHADQPPPAHRTRGFLWFVIALLAFNWLAVLVFGTPKTAKRG